jgi:hypothetical protein
MEDQGFLIIIVLPLGIVGVGLLAVLLWQALGGK